MIIFILLLLAMFIIGLCLGYLLASSYYEQRISENSFFTAQEKKDLETRLEQTRCAEQDKYLTPKQFAKQQRKFYLKDRKELLKDKKEK